MALLVAMLLLPAPFCAEAAPNAGTAPLLHKGDYWKYIVSDGSGRPLNNLTVRVVDERDVRAGNSTIRAYNLTQKLTPYLPPVKTNLSDRARWGPVYTVVETNLTLRKSDLCTLSSEATIRSVHYADVTVDIELLAFSPSDGRLRFPLSAGASWNATFNQTRTRQYPFHRVTENTTVTRLYECQAFEKLPDGREGFRIRSTDAATGSETVSWFSPGQRADVRREERDGPAGTMRVYALVRHESGLPPSIFSNPQTLLAIAFGLAALAMLAGALYTAYRARHPSTGHDVKRPAASAPEPPAAPLGAPGKGPGRSL
jgi:hypothetical protein